MTTQKKNSRLSARAILCQILGMLMALTVALPSAAGDAKSVYDEVRNSVVEVTTVAAYGSGVIVGEDIVVTNHHVVEEIDEDGIQIRQAKDEHATEWHDPIKAERAWCEEKQDLCLLYVPGVLDTPDAKIATMGEAKALSIGDEIYTFGNPDGFELSLTRGIVSKLNHDEARFGYDFGRISAPIVQTDADILGGSSGGGLFNGDGELIGITTFTVHGERETDKTELSFAMPVELVAELLADGILRVEKEHVATALAGALRYHAGAGNVQAQFDLGWFYDSIEEGDKIARHQLTDGERWLVGSSSDLFNRVVSMKAAEWFMHAAQKGHLTAQYNLATMYDDGIGVGKVGDKTAAASWFQQVVEAEEDNGLWPFAARRLGQYYDKGQGGVEANEEKAAEHFRMAADGLLQLAEQGDAEGQYYLAELHKEGKGVEQSLRKAYIWFFIAAHNGDEDAAAEVEKMRGENNGFDISDAQAEAETSIANSYIAHAEEGNLNAGEQYYLGGLYKEGRGVEQDAREAYIWFFIAAGNGDKDAIAEVREMREEYDADSIRNAQAEAAIYLAGQGADTYEVYVWLFIAAQNGDENAATEVGEMREENDADIIREAEEDAEARLKEILGE